MYHYIEKNLILALIDLESFGMNWELEANQIVEEADAANTDEVAPEEEENSDAQDIKKEDDGDSK